MRSWMTRIIQRQARSDLTTNPVGLDDGGLGLSGGLYNLMSKDCKPHRKKKRHGIYKKINPDPLTRPGEQENPQM